MDEQCTVFLCRGCCCGTSRKHPHHDHAAQLHRLHEHIGHRARVRISDCLGPCERSNIALIVPSRAARQSGARPVWLGWILDDTATDAIAAWVRDGGPGRAASPALLQLHQFDPPRRTGPVPP